MLRSKNNFSIIRNQRKRVTQSKSNAILAASDPNWIDRFVEISTHLSFGDYDKTWFEEVHLDILRDLCNEQLPSDYILHLLTLLELIAPLLDSEDKIEQTFGSLLNILTSQEQNKRPPFVMDKLVYCATSIMLFTYEWRYKSESIEDIYGSFIKFLWNKSRNNNSQLQLTCLESLTEISSLRPESLDLISNNLSSAKNLSESIYMMALFNSKQNALGLREIAQNIRYIPDLKFYHLCVSVFNLIDSGHYKDSISLITLKPFLHRLISSNSIHDIHFALKLLIKFGFEIFSSLEEEFFMKQLVILSTLPSLPIGYRLLILSFIKLAFISIYKPPLNSPPLGLIDSLCPYLFDGPDTQEKKMAILNEFSFVITDKEFFNLLSRLHKLSDSQCNNYKRATGSLFRALNISLKKRPQLLDRVLNFLLESIFFTSYIHYIEKLFAFLGQHWHFAQLFVDKFIAKLMILLKDQDCNDNQTAVTNAQYSQFIRSYNQYFSFLQLINWFLSVAHHHIVLTEFQLEFIVNFIRINCIQWPQSSTLALTCCTSILYYQRVTPKVKEALLTILEWLKNERKMDIETSSLAQIYLLALRTLKEEYIKQVFTSDEEEFLIQKVPESFDDYLCSIVRNEQSQCPLTIERVISEQQNARHKYDSPLWLTIPFNIYLSKDSPMDRLFCVDIVFTSSQIDNFKQTFQFPFIEKANQKPIRICMNLDFKINNPFWLNISTKFVDYVGTIYNYCQTECEFIPLEDVFIAVDVSLNSSTNNLLEEISKNLMRHPDSLQTVICVRNYTSFESFFQKYSWIKQFLVQSQMENNEKYYNLVIGLSPDRLIIGSIKLVNSFINLYLTTNNYEIIPSLLLHTFEKIESL